MEESALAQLNVRDMGIEDAGRNAQQEDALQEADQACWDELVGKSGGKMPQTRGPTSRQHRKLQLSVAMATGVSRNPRTDRFYRRDGEVSGSAGDSYDHGAASMRDGADYLAVSTNNTVK